MARPVGCSGGTQRTASALPTPVGPLLRRHDGPWHRPPAGATPNRAACRARLGGCALAACMAQGSRGALGRRLQCCIRCWCWRWYQAWGARSIAVVLAASAGSCAASTTAPSKQPCCQHHCTKQAALLPAPLHQASSPAASTTAPSKQPCCQLTHLLQRGGRGRRRQQQPSSCQCAAL